MYGELNLALRPLAKTQFTFVHWYIINNGLGWNMESDKIQVTAYNISVIIHYTTSESVLYFFLVVRIT